MIIMLGLYARMTGKLLGNGDIKKRKEWKHPFFISHTSLDLNWAMYCCDQLKQEGLPIRPIFENNACIVQSTAHSTIDTLYEIWYEDRKKIIPLRFVEEHLTEESLAWWYQDRGHLKKKENGTLEKLIISAEQWTDEERGLLQHVLNLKFGLLFAVDGQKRLLLYDQLQINYFLTLVQPWMQLCMVRKMKTITVRKPIAKRTTIRLPDSISL